MQVACFLCQRKDVRRFQYWFSYGQLIEICRGCEARKLWDDKAKWWQNHRKEEAVEMADHPTYLERL